MNKLVLLFFASLPGHNNQHGHNNNQHGHANNQPQHAANPQPYAGAPHPYVSGNAPNGGEEKVSEMPVAVAVPLHQADDQSGGQVNRKS